LGEVQVGVIGIACQVLILSRTHVIILLSRNVDPARGERSPLLAAIHIAKANLGKNHASQIPFIRVVPAPGTAHVEPAGAEHL